MIINAQFGVAKMLDLFRRKTLGLVLCSIGVTGCSGEKSTASLQAENLDVAEGMIDAFYSFDPRRLQPFLEKASYPIQLSNLRYQGWAEGSNYRVVSRMPCVTESETEVSCSVIFKDDPSVVLEIDFDIMETFHLTFEDGDIKNAIMNSNDQRSLFEARKWVGANMPQIFEGPCKNGGDERKVSASCARGMTQGYRQFMAAKAEQAESNSVL